MEASRIMSARKPTYRASLIQGGDGLYLTILYRAEGELLYWMKRQ